MNNNGVVDQADVTTFQGLFGASCATIPTDCPADYNGDGIITSADLTPFLADYALGPNCVQCDLNGDGNVNQNDVTLFQGLFGTSCNNPTPPTCVGDYDGDGVITSSDLTLFLADYALGQNCVQCDINGDGIINNNDANAFKAIFGTNCPQPNTCPDYNNDGIINASDLTLFLNDYALGQNCVMCDINGDGVVSPMDADFFVTLFGTKCGKKKKNLDINETETTAIGLALYPNPTSDGVNIMLNNGTAINSQNTLYVMDVSGRVIEQLDYNLTNGIIRLNVQNFESGTYFISLMTNEQHYQSKLVVK
ncbi:MAG: GC-type dockerin domain-anchored protein [Crocinitomicaceae bacterium]